MTGAGDAAGPAREARIGIINVSDRAAAGVYEDLPGKAIVAALAAYLEDNDWARADWRGAWPAKG